MRRRSRRHQQSDGMRGLTRRGHQDCLDLIDSKAQMGLLTLLDEECAIQSGSDAKFVQKARERHKKHAYFDALPSRPPITPPGDESEIEAAFTFERENLNVNDLRILIANDLFRAQHTPRPSRGGGSEV